MASQKKSQKDNKNQPITKITVTGFKALANPNPVEVKPLTLLAGANSSGKSSLMQPLLMLKQTLQAPYDPGDLLLDGPNVKFTNSNQFFSKLGSKAAANRFSIEVEVNQNSSFLLNFQKDPKLGIKICDLVYQQETTTVHIYPEMTSEEIKAILPSRYFELEDILAKTGEPLTYKWQVWKSRGLLQIVFSPKQRQESAGGAYFTAFPPLYLINEPIRKIIHVPGLRGNPARTYQTSAVGSIFPGTFENYVASIVTHWQNNADSRLQDLSQALKTLGLTWKVEAKRVDETQVELLVGRLTQGQKGKAQDTVSIADVGFGVSQVLPVVVALLAAEEGQLVYLEQPEIHLHPRAQVAMAQVIANAAQRGVRVVVETHSSLLLRGVQTLVAKGQLSPELVKLHWFTRNPKNGATEIRSADLDENGAFGDWPEDFDDVTLDTERDYLDAVEMRALKQ